MAEALNRVAREDGGAMATGAASMGDRSEWRACGDSRRGGSWVLDHDRRWAAAARMEWIWVRSRVIRWRRWWGRDAMEMGLRCDGARQEQVTAHARVRLGRAYEIGRLALGGLWSLLSTSPWVTVEVLNLNFVLILVNIYIYKYRYYIYIIKFVKFRQ
jgi:hypothetical protein